MYFKIGGRRRARSTNERSEPRLRIVTAVDGDESSAARRRQILGPAAKSVGDEQKAKRPERETQKIDLHTSVRLLNRPSMIDQSPSTRQSAPVKTPRLEFELERGDVIVQIISLPRAEANVDTEEKNNHLWQKV